ncbi:helix-turn-helix domain-containing protein [Thalassobacillus devorans]|uniref:helix-turn-helix domain-containing protein n=1 Tax=Thalassobacillus devorans TaxID=279813 RepID=UPI000A1CEF83|nr:helix-turn-helix transcriptional regulator [Thalassobacillus devorans]
MKLRIKLDHLMKERGLTQRELSEEAGVRQAAISQLARGYVSRISIDHIERIATALNITDINELITLVDNEEDA